MCVYYQHSLLVMYYLRKIVISELFLQHKIDNALLMTKRGTYQINSTLY